MQHAKATATHYIGMWKKIVHGAIFIAVILQLFSCIFGGTLRLPEELPAAPHSW